MQVYFPIYLSPGFESNTDEFHGSYINDSSGSKWLGPLTCDAEELDGSEIELGSDEDIELEPWLE